jgi:hypothetical protein
MGADLYIRNKDNDKIQETYLDAFDKAVAARDKYVGSRHADEEGLDILGLILKEDAEYNRLQAAVDAAFDAMFVNDPYYFRDSYNDSSILWQFGLSWWKDLEPFMKPWNEEEYNADPNSYVNMTVEGTVGFMNLIRSHEETFEKNMAGVTDPEHLTYYREKRKKLYEFLNLAIANGGFYASV